MNAEIIEALEEAFPEPESVEHVVDGVISKLLEARPDLLERAAERIGSLANSGELVDYVMRFKIHTSARSGNQRRKKHTIRAFVDGPRLEEQTAASSTDRAQGNNG
jgi:hypothetical protein